MGDKKHIDRLFQERFKDFEAKPDDAVWENIEAKLNEKKKKRRVIPIWWRYAGVAALLVLLLTLGSKYFSDDTTETTPQVVDTEHNDLQNTKETEHQNPNNMDATESVISNVDTNNEDSKATSNSSEEKSVEETLKLNTQSSYPSVANSNNSKEKTNNTEKTSVSNKNTNTSKPLFNSEGSKVIAKNRTSDTSENSLKNDASVKNNVVVGSKTQKSKVVVADNSIIKTDKSDTSVVTDAITKKEQKQKVTIADNSIVKTKETNKSTSNKKEDNPVEIAENNTKKETQTIEEAIEKNESLHEEDDTNIALNKWSIAPNAAPVYFNSLGKGSSIDPQFNNNSKSGEVNMSYGLNASYAINNRVTIRSGINRVNLGYNTNDVVVFQSVNASASNIKTLETISSNASDEVVPTTAVSAGDDVTIISAQAFKSNNNIAAFDASNTTINQTFGYIEIPLEIQYALSTKRFGVNVIGGFSSLFLNNNELFSDVEGERIRLGAADNINKTSYSANFGLGLNYKVSKKINLNLEPMFKYQINTFKNTSGDFQPFFIGVYTGFGIKF